MLYGLRLHPHLFGFGLHRGDRLLVLLVVVVIVLVVYLVRRR
ncbi:MAG TPA: hypothetical protein VF049_07315 [Nocardioidaceae bacterium]|jgi:hypothetical protein